jgi:hypothetical protein
MSREAHVQFCERLGVGFPGATHLVILIDSHPRCDWLARAVEKRLREELANLKVEINEEKSKLVDLANGGSFNFLGFEFRRIRGRNRKWRPYYAPVKEEDGAVCKAQGDLPTTCQPAGGGGDQTDQPDPPRLGELLCRGRFQRMLFVCQRLGGEEGSGTSDACPGAIRSRLE